MANHKSALKRARQTLLRNAINTTRRNRVRTFIRKFKVSLVPNHDTKVVDLVVAAEALRVAQAEIAKAQSSGILHRNTASRKISRLTAAYKKLAS